MANRSTFPTTIDTFQEKYEMSASDKQNMQRYQELKLKTPLSTAEETELNNLTTSLSPFLINAETFNKLQDAMVNIENFTKETMLTYYKYQGLYDNAKTYKVLNSVRYNNEIYMALQDTLGNIPTDETYWLKLNSKGDKGDPGLGLVYIGDYDNLYAYNVGNTVTYENKIWYCISPSIGHIPTDTIYWKQFIAVSTEAKDIDVADAENRFISVDKNIENILAEIHDDIEEHKNSIDPHQQYALDIDLNNLAGAGRTNETVKGVADQVNAHLADIVTQPTANKILKLDGNGQFPFSVMGGSVVKNNFGALVAPTTTDDSGKGYAVGSRWTTSLAEYVCLDKTANAAVWIKTGEKTLAPRNGLIAEYTMDSVSGTTLNDTSGNGNNGTITGATSVTGLVGNALLFGSNKYVSINISSPKSISLWAKAPSSFVGHNTLVSGTTSDNDYVLDYQTTQKFTMYIGNSYSNSLGDISVNEVFHVVLNYVDSSNTDFFKNGIYIGRFTKGLPTLGKIGTGYSPSVEYWSGWIDQFRVYNRTLTQSEIETLYNGGVGV